MNKRLFDCYWNYLSPIFSENFKEKDLREKLLYVENIFNNEKKCTYYKHISKGILEARIKVNKAIIEYVKLAFMGRDGNRLHELRELKMKSTLSNELKSELETLEREFEKLTINKFVTEQPENYAKYLHRAYQEILPKYGIKYETNFSNLLKYDA